MMKLISSFSVMLGLLVAGQSHGVSPGCRYFPREFVTLSDRMIRSFYSNPHRNDPGAIVFPYELPLQTDVDLSMSLSTNQTRGILRWETILRPTKTAYVNLIGLVTIKLDHDRDLMYICINDEIGKPRNSHVTIYFMSASGLNPRRGMNAGLPLTSRLDPSQLFDNTPTPLVWLSPVTAEIMPLSNISDTLTKVSDWVPILGTIFKIPAALPREFGKLIVRGNKAIGAGVERIVIRNNIIEFATDVNVNNPDQALILYRLPLPEEYRMQ